MTKKSRRSSVSPDAAPSKPSRFAEWLAVYFEPYDEVANPFDAFPPESGQDPPSFSGTDDEIIELFTYTMHTCGETLKDYSDFQVGNGLNVLLSTSFSDVAFHVRDGEVDPSRRFDAIHSLKRLYADCFARRCPPALAQIRGEYTGEPLQYICYMLWDITPLNYWGNRPNESEAAYHACMDVMESALYLGNDACAESGLHGLGHMHYLCPHTVETIIGQFLAENADARPELLKYARAARAGRIQ